MKIENPKPLKINWLRKSVESAKSGMETLPDGRFRCWIEHEIINGVTPKMLVWWFSHLEGEVEIKGKKYNRYRVWHPEDHVFLEYAKRNPDGKIGVGSVIHLAEMLNANPKYLIHIYTKIKKLDETGYIHQPSMHGLKIAQMDYEFEAVENGTLYKNSLTIGFTGLLGKIFNPLIKKFIFDEARGKAWIRHNIEEVGNFEFFLPKLYQSETMKKKCLIYYAPV
ncbi:MAG TPA: hypothetical protein PKY82_33885 [Pyrinomonadaceae bacterium]|nr:hypothetical protein [Pyrinomonadaceae bacterium]